MKVKEESGKASLKFNIQKTKIMASSPISSVQSLRHVWLCNPVDCNMPGFPVHHQLLELAKIHVHWVGEAIQPSRLPSSPSQFSSVAQSCPTLATPWIAACQASLSITNSRSPPKSMSIKSMMPSNHLIFCHLLLLLPSIFPSNRVFSNESTLCVRWPKYWSFGFSISPSNEHPGLISFRMNWLDLLAVQVTLKSLLQHHSSKASVLLHSAFFTVQLSHQYMPTGKTIALTRRTFFGKVMSMLF